MGSSGTILVNILPAGSQPIPRDPIYPIAEVATARLVGGDYAWLSQGIILRGFATISPLQLLATIVTSLDSIFLISCASDLYPTHQT